MSEVEKYRVVIPVADVHVQESASMRATLAALFGGTETPAEREKRRAEWETYQREQAERRAAVRAEKGVTYAEAEYAWEVEAYVRKAEEAQGWPPGYIQHLAQPYCECGPDRDDGWEFCEHVRDLWPGR